MKSSIEHIALFADNLEASKDFFVRLFDMRVVLDNSKAPVRGYFLANESGSVLEMIERPQGQTNSDQRYVCHLAFAVEDVESARRVIESEGLVFETDTVVDTPEFKTAFFLDPEGNRIQILKRMKSLV
ncbi:MAG: VOC family protein [Planctomycetota bacterium]|nr:MAG: VOC family protein [Planctomycetota bacterium]